MSRHFKYLLIDNSNSRTKFAAASRDSLGERRTIPTPEINAASLEEISADWDCDHVVLSSVVPEKARVIAEFFGERILHVTHEIELGVAVDFPDPSTIGADRLANAAAVVALYKTPAIVIDFGTAVTFDVVSAENSYVGGVIAPGLDVMTDYLHQRTALLPKIDITEPVEVIGKSTESAMLSGAVHGYRGLIKEIIAQIEDKFAADAGHANSATLVATGGYAQLISSKIPGIKTVNPDLTLEGLRVIANLNFEI